ncbi:acyl carrier protein [Cognatiluteimonas profundi]|uniref:acyl carrier protein n=1 Tax=Cognatiluteimonas profundi TaxID=2594501 RepID=UPI00131B7E9B|nr:acyl carrier protein [Lysobacter profundi]
MDQSITEQVFDIVARHGGIDRSTLTSTSTLKDLGIDSLEAIETIFDIEEHFDINFPNRDPNLDDGTLAGLIQSVQQALAPGAGAVPTT